MKIQATRLKAVAKVLSDQSLARLAHAQERCRKTQSDLDVLSPCGNGGGFGTWGDVPLRERHDQWLLQRRKALNEQLAREMSECDHLHEQAVKAFARVEALSRLAARSDK